jgi:hypothetical protein
MLADKNTAIDPQFKESLVKVIQEKYNFDPKVARVVTDIVVGKVVKEIGNRNAKGSPLNITSGGLNSKALDKGFTSLQQTPTISNINNKTIINNSNIKIIN